MNEYKTKFAEHRRIKIYLVWLKKRKKRERKILENKIQSWILALKPSLLSVDSTLSNSTMPLKPEKYAHSFFLNVLVVSDRTKDLYAEPEKNHNIL